MKSLEKNVWRVFLVVQCTLFLNCVMNKNAENDLGNMQWETSNISAESIIGYWESRSDGLLTHITEVSQFSPGNGSFTDIEGRLIPDGKLRNISYVGKNKWTCDVYRHSPSLIYPENEYEVMWIPSEIKMVNMNVIIVDGIIYDRR